MRLREFFSSEVKIFVMPPLVATTVLGLIYYLASGVLALGLISSLVIFWSAIVLIPLANYYFGRLLLGRILGADLDRTVQFAKSIADGSHEPSETFGSHGDSSIVASIERLASQVADIAVGIAANVEKINSGVEQLSAGANEILFTSQMQTASVNDAKEVMSNMSQSIQAVSDLTRDTEAISNKATQLSASGESVVEEAVQVMKQIADAMTVTSQQINVLTSHAQDIGTVATVIKAIADQTNLLALNAAIEAARAGEMGRGFAVVADEVRNLAERTGQSTQEITATIRMMQEQTQDAMKGIHLVLPLTEQGVEKANLASETLRSIRTESQNTLEKISQLTVQIDAQTQLANNVVGSVTQVLDMTANTDTTTERILQTSVALSRTATELLNQSRNQNR
jgi:methyl-accepting chemotaxis protein